jgi:signal transduction histidine kinase
LLARVRVGVRIVKMRGELTRQTKNLAQQNKELEEAVRQLEAAHAQLVQSEKMASIGQLAAGVAHEINNPLGFISSNLNSLQAYIDDVKKVAGAQNELLQACLSRQDVDGVARRVNELLTELDFGYVLNDLDDLVSESVEGAQRVRQIVADLRDFSHVDAPDVNEENVNQLLDKTINVAWNELKYKTEVVREYGDIPPLPCYGGRLNQVFLNLLVNAAHAIEEKGVVTIRTGATDLTVWIEIEDTGCGIPSENLAHIFDPFFTTKSVGEGTGLGLHLVQTIVNAHGGAISLRSTVGAGTTFRVDLPLSGPPQTRKENQPA